MKNDLMIALRLASYMILFLALPLDRSGILIRNIVWLSHSVSPITRARRSHQNCLYRLCVSGVCRSDVTAHRDLQATKPGTRTAAQNLALVSIETDEAPPRFQLLLLIPSRLSTRCVDGDRGAR